MKNILNLVLLIFSLFYRIGISQVDELSLSLLKCNIGNIKSYNSGAFIYQENDPLKDIYPEQTDIIEILNKYIPELIYVERYADCGINFECNLCPKQYNSNDYFGYIRLKLFRSANIENNECNSPLKPMYITYEKESLFSIYNAEIYEVKKEINKTVHNLIKKFALDYYKVNK